MSLAATYSRIRPGIVAFLPAYFDQIKPGSQPWEHIFGTGFIVGDSIIATNAHVIATINKCFDPQTKQHAAYAMLNLQHGEGFWTRLYPVAAASFVQTMQVQGVIAETPDIGLVALNYKGLSKIALPLNTTPVDEGTPVATSGFPMGPMLLHLAEDLERLSPTLQAGIVSAVLPYPGAPPWRYLVNIMVQEGASGSPVFLPDSGEVMGIIYARTYQPLRIAGPFGAPITMRIPTNFSRVVPAEMIHRLLNEETASLMESVKPDAPHLDDEMKNISTEGKTEIQFGKILKGWSGCGGIKEDGNQI